MTEQLKMRVDIWSDIMCPFCYIGKRKFEIALEQFRHKENIEVVWHSFQLDPTTKPQPGKDIYDYVAEMKGQTREWSLGIHAHVVQMAKEVGLTYNFDTTVIANSFDAHRLIQLAKKNGLGDEMEEKLFLAYFTEGKDVADHATLLELGKNIGLDEAAIKLMLENADYTNEVNQDINQAQVLGIRGVPFFVINNKYGVSGAQPSEIFEQALQQAWSEFEKEHPAIIDLSTANGAACTPDGFCG